MIKKLYRVVIVIFLCTICVLTLSSCIPPFIDGVVEAEEYFDSSVQYASYIIDASAEGGFTTIDGQRMPLSTLTDSDENNVSMKYYYCFSFTTKKEITLQAISFVVEVENFTMLNFRLNNRALVFDQSIDLTQKKKEIVQFSELNLLMPIATDLSITISNPVMANVKYRIDTILFIV